MFQLGVCLLRYYDNTLLAFAFLFFFLNPFQKWLSNIKPDTQGFKISNGSNETLNSNLTAILMLGSMFLGATSHCGLVNV